MNEIITVQEVRVKSDKGADFTGYIIYAGKKAIEGLDWDGLMTIHRIIGKFIEEKGGKE